MAPPLVRKRPSPGPKNPRPVSELIVQAFLNYKRTFGRSDVSGMLMFNSDNVTVFGPASGTRPLQRLTPPILTSIIMGQAGSATAYKNTYLAEFSAAYMGTDIFAPGHRYGFFPAASVGWVMSNESFLRQNKAITFLKLRGSYGLVGNDIIASQGLSTRYLYTATYGGGTYYFGTGNTATGGYAENVVANPNVTWEKEKSLNVGVDITLFKKFDLAFDYFNRDRYDILVPSASTTPLVVGVPSPLLNQGKSNNRALIWLSIMPLPAPTVSGFLRR